MLARIHSFILLGIDPLLLIVGPPGTGQPGAGADFRWYDVSAFMLLGEY